eukprot:403346884
MENQQNYGINSGIVGAASNIYNSKTKQQPSPYFGSNQNKPIYLGDEKNLKKKRGAELLQTDEDDQEQFDRDQQDNYQMQMGNVSQNYIPINQQFAVTNNNQLFNNFNRSTSPTNANKSLYSVDSYNQTQTDKSRTNKIKSNNLFHGVNTLQNKTNSNVTGQAQQNIIESEVQNNVNATIGAATQNLRNSNNSGGNGPNISVINYNNPTINMNFNENQFSNLQELAATAQQTIYEDPDFYDQLNFSKAHSSKKSNNAQNHFKTAGPGSLLGQKLQSLASATMNQQANAIIKTVPNNLTNQVNPYADNEPLSRSTKNMNQPMSQQISRANSRQDLNSSIGGDDQGNSDIDEIGMEVQKKKVIKKKVIKKIIKRKNPDGTDAPTQVTTIIIDKDQNNKNQQQINNNANSLNNYGLDSTSTSNNLQSTHNQSINQDQSVIQPNNGEPKRKIIKKIIKKKKKPADGMDANEQNNLQSQQQLLQQQQQQLLMLQKQQEEQAIQKKQEYQQEMLKQKQQLQKLTSPTTQFNPKQQRSGNKHTDNNQTTTQNDDGADSQDENDLADEEVQIIQQRGAKKTQMGNIASRGRNSRQQIPKEEAGSIEIPQRKQAIYNKKQQQQDDEDVSEAYEEKKIVKNPQRRRENTNLQSDQDDNEEDEEEQNTKLKKLQIARKQKLLQQQQRMELEETKNPDFRQNAKRAQSEMGHHQKTDIRKGIKKTQQQQEQQSQNKKIQQSKADSNIDQEEDADEYDSEEEYDSEDVREEVEGSDDSAARKLKEYRKQQQKLEVAQMQLNREKMKLEKQKPMILQQQQNQAQNGAQMLKPNGQPLIQKPLSFKVAICDPESYKAFVDQIVYGTKMRELIMSPIPFQMGQLRFTIERHRTGFNRIHPSYYIYLEKNQGGRLLILYAKKRAFNKTANYLISMEKNKKTRSNDVCLGKLRANPEGDKYVLYDNGENYTKASHSQQEKIRNEHGVFQYRYEPCNVGNIRKMVVVVPILQQTTLAQGMPVDNTLPLGQDQNGNLVVMTQKLWKPLKDQDTIIETFTREGVRNLNYQVFVDNPPAWNPKTNTYVYDFKGRVTQPSIKNFQLIPEMDGRRQVTLQDFVLQFGKNGKDQFILDVQYPFSIFQAFGLALSAFDTD